MRNFTGEAITEEKLKTVIEAGLLSESGNNRRAWEFIVVREREHLKELTGCKVGSGKMLEKAGAAIIVLVDQTRQDIWIDDGAIAMANMHLCADSLGIGSCYINGRCRQAVDGGSVEDFIKRHFDLPDRLRLVAILALGMADPVKRPPAHELSEADWTKVHDEKF